MCRSAYAAVHESIVIFKIIAGQDFAGLPDLEVFGNIDQLVHADLAADPDCPSGIGEIMMAKRLLMILSGSNKADAARQLLMSDAVTCACPATLMKLHHDATVIITRELADAIGYKG